MTSLYENHGKLWTVKETKQLMKEVKNMEINHIALLHKRTPNAIFLKLIHEASKIAEEEDDDFTLEDLSVITSLSPSKLLEGFKEINYTKFEEEENNNSFDDEYKYDNLQRAIVFTLILGGAVYFFKEYLKYLQMDYN